MTIFIMKLEVTSNHLLLKERVGENNACIPPTLEGWVYIKPTHGPLDGALYTWAQYTPTLSNRAGHCW